MFLYPGTVQQPIQMDESQVGLYCNAGQRAVQVGHRWSISKKDLGDDFVIFVQTYFGTISL